MMLDLGVWVSIYDSIYLPTGADSGDACWGSISISAVGVSGTWAKSPARKSAAGSDPAKIIFLSFLELTKIIEKVQV